MTNEMYREFFAEDVAQLSAAEREAVQKVVRNFYRWQGHGCNVGELIDALTNSPRVGP